MIRKFTLLILFFCPIILLAQNLTGVWRGYFVQKDFNTYTGSFTDDTYKYEVQINQKPDNSIDGVTYSYKRTEFYGKASLHGLLSKKTNNIIIKEIRLIEHHSSNATSTTCLMTCYFDYVKRGKLEMLTGTYTSINTDGSNNNNCGEGTVYLEKVEESDFDRESFLEPKKNNKTVTKANPIKKKTPSIDSDSKNITKTTKHIDNQTKTNTNKPGSNVAKANTNHTNSTHHNNDGTNLNSNTAKHSTVANAKKVVAAKTRADSIALAISIAKLKPGAETFVLKNKVDNEIDTFYKYKIDTTVYVYDSPNNKHAQKNRCDSSSNSKDSLIPRPKTILESVVPIPKQLIERENPLINTIQVDEKEVRIDYYDNGEIDNDTISVYDNNKNVVNGGRLSYSPITLNLVFSNEVPVHEIITVAENLGDIPPNTALMVITFGKKRYEVFIASDEKRNAKVILEYKPKAKSKQ